MKFIPIIFFTSFIWSCFSTFPFFLTDHQCPGTTQTCYDDETCCPLGQDDYMCCYNTTVPTSTCCGDGCCTDFEECCADSEGVSCCIQQDTYCVPDQLPTYPARCCPRWTVGCSVGSVGCCDPAQPWQWSIESKFNLARRMGNTVITPKSSRLRSNKYASKFDAIHMRDSSVGPVVYALFITGLFGLQALTIDPLTGNVTNKVRVIGMDDNPAGESTREFLFDAHRKSFYYLDANFTANGGIRPKKGRPIYLYIIDAVTGVATKKNVQGATDYPIGQVMLEDKILMSTKRWTGNKFTGFNFFTLDPSTAKATSLGSVARGNDEGDPGYYAGYHRACSKDGKMVFRLGYKMVTTQNTQGIDITTLDGSHSSVEWRDELSPQHDYYMSIDRFDFSVSSSIASPSFLSLAPSLDDPDRGLDVVQWNLDNSSNITVIATLGDAHPPRVSQLGDLGYIGSYINGQKYIAMVVHNGPLPIADEWALATVDMSTGQSDLLPLVPRAMAQTESVSGIGLA